MPNEDLEKYIKTELAKGTIKENIVPELLKSGWQESQIQNAFADIEGLKTQNIQTDNYPQTSTADLEPSVDSQLRNAWKNFTAKIRLFMVFALVPAIFSFLLSFMLSPFQALSTSSNASNAAKTTAVSYLLGIFTNIWSIIGVVLLIYIIYVVVQSITHIALIYTIGETNPTFLGAYKTSFKKILSYWWVAFLSAILIFGGFLFFIIPGIIFSVWFTFILYILVLEGKKGFKSILESRNLIKRSWFSVWTRIILTSIISLFWLILIPVILLVNLIWPVSNFNIQGYILNFVGNFLILLINAFIACFLFEVYKGLKMIKNQQNFVSSKKTILGFGLGGYLVGILIIVGIVIYIGSMFKNTNYNSNTKYPYSNPYANNKFLSPTPAVTRTTIPLLPAVPTTTLTPVSSATPTPTLPPVL